MRSTILANSDISESDILMTDGPARDDDMITSSLYILLYILITAEPVASHRHLTHSTEDDEHSRLRPLARSVGVASRDWQLFV